MITIKNEALTVQIAELGAELQSIRSAAGREYLWHGDGRYWNRRSPVLFPIVGNVWQKRYTHNGTEYAMGQHGFARDMEFAVVRQSEAEVLFALESTPESLKLYPFDFRLEIGYALEGNLLRVSWHVVNTGTEEMPFQIGAHPAFIWDNADESRRGSFLFDNAGPVSGTLLDEGGCIHLEPQYFSQALEEAGEGEGRLRLTHDSFDAIDTLVLEHDQVHSVTLCDNQDRPIVRVRYAAPVLGLWTPTGLKAPFVCIEPWYGRCDRARGNSELTTHDWTQHLQPAADFATDYTVELF